MSDVLYEPNEPGHWWRISPHGITVEVVHRGERGGLTRRSLRVWCDGGSINGCPVGIMPTVATGVCRWRKPGRWVKITESVMR